MSRIRALRSVSRIKTHWGALGPIEVSGIRVAEAGPLESGFLGFIAKLMPTGSTVPGWVGRLCLSTWNFKDMTFSIAVGWSFGS